MRTKTNTISARPDYLASYPTSAPHMRKCPGAVELDYGLDHSEHCYRRSDLTSFSSRNGRSVEHCKEVLLLIILTVLKWQLMPVFLSDASIAINLFLCIHNSSWQVLIETDGWIWICQRVPLCRWDQSCSMSMVLWGWDPFFIWKEVWWGTFSTKRPAVWRWDPFFI